MPSVSFQSPTDYTAEQAAIERQRRLAEALRMQSEQPLDTNQMAGGWVVPVSRYAGLAKMLQGYNARKSDENATERERALAERRRTEGAVDVQNFMGAITGTPAREAQTTAEPGNDFIPGQEAVPADRKKALAIALMSQNPMVAGAGQSMLAEMLKSPESLFSKIDPKDYTPESIRLFTATKDPAVLVPVRKMEPVNTGGTTQFINPYAPPTQPIAHTQTPDSVARLAQAQQQFNSLSAQQQLNAQFEAARLGISLQELLISRANAANKGIETNFNTGGGVVPGMPTLPQIPQVPQAGAPNAVPTVAPVPQAPMQAPQVAPQGRRTGVYQSATTPGLTPASQQKLLVERGGMDTKREFNMAGINSSLDEAERILSGTGKFSPTSSGLGSIVDSVGGFFGASPNGAAEAAQLKSIGGSLIAKMPRMEGPQSDKDVLLYRQMAGQIGDDTVPIKQRLAALQTVRQLYAKYEKSSSSAPSGFRVLGVE